MIQDYMYILNDSKEENALVVANAQYDGQIETSSKYGYSDESS